MENETIADSNEARAVVASESVTVNVAEPLPPPPPLSEPEPEPEDEDEELLLVEVEAEFKREVSENNAVENESKLPDEEADDSWPVTTEPTKEATFWLGARAGGATVTEVRGYMDTLPPTLRTRKTRSLE